MTLETIGQDLRYALRGLRAKPGFTFAVVLTLALGIGANAAMFSVVDRMLFRPPPYLADPATAHRIYFPRMFRGTEFYGGSVPFAEYEDVARWTHSFSRLAMFADENLAVGVGDAAREMPIGVVTASFFDFFDASPAIGRWFGTREDSPPDGTPVAVLGYGYWQQRFGGRRDALGSTIQIGSVVYTIVGVAPRGFAGMWPARPRAAYIPFSVYASSVVRSNPFLRKEIWNRTYHWSFAQVMARRRPNVSIESANGDLTAAVRRSWEAERTASPRLPPLDVIRPRGVVASILAERGPNESSFAKVATWIGGVALVVLIIACANVANLLLARALRRRREIAVRLALGVSRARLLSQLLAESLILALLGGMAGLLVAYWGGSLLRAEFLPREAELAVLGDSRTLFFAAAIALGAGVLTGIAPVFQSRRADLTSDLKAGAREGTYHRSTTRVALLVLQGALSVLLLVGAGLFVRSLRNVQSMRLGFDVDPLLLVYPNMRGIVLDSTRATALRRDLLDAAVNTPGVTHASLEVSVPFWSNWEVELYVTGIDTVSRLGDFRLNAVSPDYFATMGTRILQGRGITDADRDGAPRAMVVSQAMARTLWPGKNAIGQCVRVNADTVPCTYVVGVAEDIKTQSLADAREKDAGLFYYLSAPQWHPDRAGLFVRVRGDAAEHAEAIRRALQRVMPGTSYVTVTPFSDIVGDEMRSWRLGASMFLAFGLLALVLAAIGLYSVIAYNVVQRTHEMGVRVALGAQIADVVRLVVSDGMRLGVVGIVIGAAGALLGARWVKPLLFQESAHDPLVFGAVIGALLVVALAASLVPALRASRVDPNVALRTD